LGRTTQFVGLHNLSDDTTCWKTKIEAPQFLSSDQIRVVRHKTCVVPSKICVSCNHPFTQLIGRLKSVSALLR
jgi:hypothetical protein